MYIINSIYMHLCTVFHIQVHLHTCTCMHALYLYYTVCNNNKLMNLFSFLTGTEYAVPSLWRRIAAEIIDFIVLFYLKVMLTVMVLRHMGYL